jgi:ABC-type Zn uptake system ZnuABC Zn-binding protein ZnuA
LRNLLGRLCLIGLTALALLALAGCGGAETEPAAPSNGGRLQVVATTTLVGDVVSQIGGEHISLTVLMPHGADPHSFQPVPRDATLIAAADLVFINGLAFEAFLSDLLDNAGPDVTIVSVSAGIEPLSMAEDDDHADGEADDDDHDHGEADPHVWFDVNNVKSWTEAVRAALSEADPAHAADYARNATSYAAQLDELDAWILAQVAQVPPERRHLVTDHAVLGYFAHRYGFEQVGAIIPGLSTAAAPSARDLAALQATLAELDVPAIFVGNTTNPDTAEQVAADTGVRVVLLFTGSLSESGGPADSYLAFMRYNVSAIAAALAE